MTAFVSRHTEYDNFLYAIVAENEDLPITVVSMLSRLNLDPWLEAARLSQLPRHQAIDCLSTRIQRFKRQPIPTAEADELASRLIERLPTREALVVEATRQETLDFTSMWLIFAIFFGMMAFSQNTSTSEKSPRTRSVVMQHSEPSLLHHDGVRKQDSHSAPKIHIQH